MDQEIARTYRWRRRQVPRVRVTWIGLVITLMLLIHQEIVETHPMAIGGRVLLFIGVVLLPVGLVLLWRAGLLPPERVPYDPPSDPQ